NLMLNVKHLVIQALNNQDVQYDDLKKLVDNQQIFNVYLSYLNFFNEKIKLNDLEIENYTIPDSIVTTRYELEIDIIEGDDRFQLMFLYSLDLYDEDIIRLFAAYFDQIMMAILADYHI